LVYRSLPLGYRSLPLGYRPFPLGYRPFPLGPDQVAGVREALRLVAVQQRPPVLARRVGRRLVDEEGAEVHDRAGLHLDRYGGRLLVEGAVDLQVAERVAVGPRAP